MRSFPALVVATAMAWAAPAIAAADAAGVPSLGMGEDASAVPRDALRSLGITQGGIAIVGVELNGRDQLDTTELTLSSGQLMIRADDVRRYRLRTPVVPLQTIAGETFLPLSAVPGLRFSIDAARQVLRLSAPVDSFEDTALSGRPQERHTTSPVVPSAFLSYNLTVQQGTSGDSTRAVFLDMGGTNDRGTIENTMIVGNTIYGKGAVRLDTSFTHDDPGTMRRLSIGDGITRGSAWAPQVRFGGIRYGTEFSLQPSYLTFPTPSFAGRAALPSNVELYVNDVLGYQGAVGEGPFSLNQVPVVGGTGHVSLVVQDPLGVEQRIVSSFYVSTQMLRAGLSDFSIEGGAERLNYATASFDYQKPFVSGTYRRGLTPNLTVETHGEASTRSQSLGGGLSTTLANLGEMGGSVAVSDAPKVGVGTLYRAYLSRNDSHWLLSAVYQGATAKYRQIGDNQPSDRLRQVIQLNVGLTIKRWGSVNAALAQIKRGDDTTSRVISFNYSHELPRIGFLSAFVINSRATSSRSQTSVGLNFTANLGSRTSVSVTADQHNQRVDLQHLPPNDSGWGYRLSAGRGDVDQQEADLTYRNTAVEATAEVSHYQGQTTGRLLASGSFVVADGSVFAARQLMGGYALVDVDGQPGVDIYQDNRPIGTTDSKGRAIISQLRPYEENRISIEPDDLKIDATMVSETEVVTPMAHSAVRAHFRIKAGHAGSLIVHHADGTAIAPGTAVAFSADNDPSVVGFDGEIFVPALSSGLTVVVHEQAGDCAVSVPALPKDDLLPTVGPLVCRHKD